MTSTTSAIVEISFKYNENTLKSHNSSRKCKKIIKDSLQSLFFKHLFFFYSAVTVQRVDWTEEQNNNSGCAFYYYYLYISWLYILLVAYYSSVYILLIIHRSIVLVAFFFCCFEQEPDFKHGLGFSCILKCIYFIFIFNVVTFITN